MLRIGIVGLGKTVSIANYHAKALAKDARAKVVAVYDTDLILANDWSRNFGYTVRVCGSFTELLDRTDAVFICTPNFTHFNYASQALTSGKHTFVEKPLTLNVQEAEKLLEISQKSKAFSAAGFIYRFANPVLEVKRAALEILGEIYLVNGWLGGKRLSDPRVGYEWRMSRQRSGSGALGDFGSHLLDLAYFTSGVRFDTAKCLTSTVIEFRNGTNGAVAVDNDDTANLICRSGKTLGSFTASRVGMDELMLHIVGQGGMIQCNLRDSSKVLYWKKDKNGGYGGAVCELSVAAEEYFTDWFVKQDKAFIDGIDGKPTDIASIYDGCYCQRLLDKAEISSKREEEQ